MTIVMFDVSSSMIAEDLRGKETSETPVNLAMGAALSSVRYKNDDNKRAAKKVSIAPAMDDMDDRLDTERGISEGEADALETIIV